MAKSKTYFCYFRKEVRHPLRNTDYEFTTFRVHDATQDTLRNLMRPEPITIKFGPGGFLHLLLPGEKREGLRTDERVAVSLFTYDDVWESGRSIYERELHLVKSDDSTVPGVALREGNRYMFIRGFSDHDHCPAASDFIRALFVFVGITPNV